MVFDVIRGAGADLQANSTATENAAGSNDLTSFDASGFSVGSNNAVNQSGRTYVAWCWDAGTTTATNYDGQTTSTVRANASAGFSIVSWAGHGTGSTTIGHGLNAAPKLLIIKGRDNSGAWVVGSDYLGWGNRLELNTYAAAGSASADFNSTAPTNSVFTVGSNQGTGNKIAYCISPVAGYSAVGTYVGNGSDTGPFVHTGFRPAMVWTKGFSANSDQNTGWNIRDTARDTFNEASEVLSASNADQTLDNTHTGIDILSNGFKLKNDTNGQSNYNGWSYIYYAVAEHPFKTARAR